jgi:hypothetical protein
LRPADALAATLAGADRRRPFQGVLTAAAPQHVTRDRFNRLD